jgi:hypothetical protein
MKDVEKSNFVFICKECRVGQTTQEQVNNLSVKNPSKQVKQKFKVTSK